jgi:hypothetical protein
MILKAGTAAALPNVKINIIGEGKANISFSDADYNSKGIIFTNEKELFYAAVQQAVNEINIYKIIGIKLIFNNENYFISKEGYIQPIINNKYQEINETNKNNFRKIDLKPEIDLHYTSIFKEKKRVKFSLPYIPWVKIGITTCFIIIIFGIGVLVWFSIIFPSNDVQAENIPVTHKIIYNLKYITNGGKGDNVLQTCEVEAHITNDKPLCVFDASKSLFTKEKYKFVGWEVFADGISKVYKPCDQITINQDTNLLARWETIQEIKEEEKANKQADNSGYSEPYPYLPSNDNYVEPEPAPAPVPAPQPDSDKPYDCGNNCPIIVPGD